MKNNKLWLVRIKCHKDIFLTQEQEPTIYDVSLKEEDYEFIVEEKDWNTEANSENKAIKLANSDLTIEQYAQSIQDDYIIPEHWQIDKVTNYDEFDGQSYNMPTYSRKDGYARVYFDLECTAILVYKDSSDVECFDTLKEAIESADFNLAAEVIKEFVICAAIRLPDGTIFRGHRHTDCIKTAKEYVNWNKGDPGEYWVSNMAQDQGFITSYNRYVSRKEGYLLQKAAGIDSVAEGGYRGETLFSEDLY